MMLISISCTRQSQDLPFIPETHAICLVTKHNMIYRKILVQFLAQGMTIFIPTMNSTYILLHAVALGGKSYHSNLI